MKQIKSKQIFSTYILTIVAVSAGGIVASLQVIYLG